MNVFTNSSWVNCRTVHSWAQKIVPARVSKLTAFATLNTSEALLHNRLLKHLNLQNLERRVEANFLISKLSFLPLVSSETTQHLLHRQSLYMPALSRLFFSALWLLTLCCKVNGYKEWKSHVCAVKILTEGDTNEGMVCKICD